MSKKRNFLPSLILAFIIWIIIACLVYYTSPEILNILIFFGLLFIALLITLSLIFTNTRRGIISSIAITFFLILRYLQIGHVLNLLLIIGTAIAFEIYFSKKS